MVTAAIDAALRDARTLLGNGPTPTPRPAHTISTEATTSDSPWQGIARDRAIAVATELAAHVHQLHTTHTSANTTIQRATILTDEARAQLHAIHTEWEHNKATLVPYADTPTGQAALLAAGAQRLHEATTLIAATADHMAALAGEISTLATRLPISTDQSDASIQLVDHDTIPQRPAASARNVDWPANRKVVLEDAQPHRGPEDTTSYSRELTGWPSHQDDNPNAQP